MTSGRGGPQDVSLCFTGVTFFDEEIVEVNAFFVTGFDGAAGVA